ncbi:hypothetical protein GCM10027258_70920 [Amycolatopsis stemonae]
MSAVGEITVHRCVVRVVRRGGWSWGPDPRGLVRRVLDALPDLLAAEFDEYVTGDGPDVEVTEPVRLSVRLSARGGRVLVPDGLVFEAVTGGLAPGSVPVPVAVPPPGPASSASPDPADEVPGTVHSGPETEPPTFAVLVAELAARDELAALLSLLPEETLVRYLSALLVSDGFEPPGAVGGGPAAAEVPSGPVTVLAAELARRRSLARPPETRAEIAELVRSSDAVAEVVRAEVVTAVPTAAGETKVSSVLPFLLAGPLARTGYLDALGPALSGVDLLEEAPLFAAALAYQVLGAPRRGWRRTPEDDASAAAFAGCASVPDLTGFARRVRPALPVLDGVLALSLCPGHDPADPLLVTGVDDGLLLVDAEGLFPVAWAATVDGLLPHWIACGRPPVLVRDSPLPPTCLRDLAEAGVRFLTDVRPVRDDPLTRLRWRTPLWTTGGVEPRLAAHLAAGGLDELVRALFVERRAAPLAGDRALERSVALAASLGLGMIAWQLWEGESPVPALTRFADLEGTVRFTRDAVRVKLPLGRRHADLARGGLLADVPDVVWLGGRTLIFSGG